MEFRRGDRDRPYHGSQGKSADIAARYRWLYWFGSFDLYEGAYLRHYSKASNIEMGERYVAPLYNTLIAEGRDIYLHDVPAAAVIPWGSRQMSEAFARRSPPEIGMRP